MISFESGSTMSFQTWAPCPKLPLVSESGQPIVQCLGKRNELQSENVANDLFRIEQLGLSYLDIMNVRLLSNWAAWSFIPWTSWKLDCCQWKHKPQISLNLGISTHLSSFLKESHKSVRILTVNWPRSRLMFRIFEQSVVLHNVSRRRVKAYDCPMSQCLGNTC